MNSNIVLLVAVSSAWIANSLRICPDGFTPVKSHCYQMIFDQKSWFDATLDCQSKNAQLITITSKEDEDVVITGVKSTTGKLQREGIVWISLNDIYTEGTFLFPDSTPVTNASYTNWAPGKPTNSIKSNCVGVRNNLWEDLDCSLLGAYICQAELKNVNIFEPEPPTLTPTERCKAAEWDCLLPLVEETFKTLLGVMKDLQRNHIIDSRTISPEMTMPPDVSNKQVKHGQASGSD